LLSFEKPLIAKRLKVSFCLTEENGGFKKINYVDGVEICRLINVLSNNKNFIRVFINQTNIL